MADHIIISDLRARCIIGINPEERREKQDILINVTLVTDLRRAARSDCVEDSVDYRALKKAIFAMTEQSHYRLIEALAEAVAGLCLDHHAVSEVRVRVDKPFALRFAGSVAVDITRRREPGTAS